SDLFFRLNGISVVVPPLRERHEEIETLAFGFVEAAAAAAGIPAPDISNAAFAMLRAHAWPGNVRELSNTMERAVLLSSDGLIEPHHLPIEKMRALGTVPPVVKDSDSEPLPLPLPAPEDSGDDLSMKLAIKRNVQAMEKQKIAT